MINIQWVMLGHLGSRQRENGWCRLGIFSLRLILDLLIIKYRLDPERMHASDESASNLCAYGKLTEKHVLFRGVLYGTVLR